MIQPFNTVAIILTSCILTRSEPTQSINSNANSQPNLQDEDISTSNVYDLMEEAKRAWKDLPKSGWGKRSWQDLPISGWGKRGWQDLQASGWGKRGWQDLQTSGWGKRAWQNLPSSGWGKRAWKSMPSSGWGKRTPNTLQTKDPFEPNTDDYIDIDVFPDSAKATKRAWDSMKDGWGKRDASDWGSMKGAWGKRDPAWHNLKGLWGKRSSDNFDFANNQDSQDLRYFQKHTQNED